MKCPNCNKQLHTGNIRVICFTDKEITIRCPKCDDHWTYERD